MSYDIEQVSLRLNNKVILDHVNLSFHIGEVHAIIGGNGAGKSSLMKVLNGQYPYQQGRLIKDGTAVSSFRDDVTFVAQEVDEVLFNDLTVYDNLTINERKQGLFYRQQQYQLLKDQLEKWGIAVDLNAYVRELSLSQKQMIVIIRALQENKHILIFDEPTASLSAAEVQKLFEEIRLIKHEMAIIFISHRIPELLEIADKITVMENGKIAATKSKGEWTSSMLYQYITSKESYRQTARTARQERSFDLHITTSALHDIHIEAYRGEVIGICGLVGAGKTELAEYLFEHLPHCSYIPEERQKHGLVMNHSIVDNVSYAGGRLFSKKKDELEATRRLGEQLSLKYGHLTDAVSTLSGGNQQKVVIMKGLKADADIFLFDEPTIGIDIGAKQDVFHVIESLRQSGKTILYFSSDCSEIKQLTDKVYVLHKGHVADVVSTNEVSEQQLLVLASGGHKHAI